MNNGSKSIAPLLAYGIRIAGTGSGFPTGQENQVFTCSELGSQMIEIWVMDQAGNADFCQTFVDIQDNLGICPAGKAFRLFQNRPNPWNEQTVIGFYVPEATTATLTIYDVTGRQLYTASGAFGEGDNAFYLDQRLTDGFGMLYYRVETPAASATMKMMQERH